MLKYFILEHPEITEVGYRYAAFFFLTEAFCTVIIHLFPLRAQDGILEFFSYPVEGCDLTAVG